MNTKRNIIVCLLFGLLINLCRIANASDSSWSFIIVTDAAGGFMNKMRGAIDHGLANNDDVKFIACTGDLEIYFEGASGQVGLEPYLHSIASYFPPEDGITRFPWFDVPGNHNCDDSTATTRYVTHFANVLGPYYATQLPGMENFKEGPYDTTGTYPVAKRYTTYSFDYGDAHFMFWNQFYKQAVDGSEYACVYDIMYDWFKQDLQQNTKPIIFVFGHKATWMPTEEEQGGCNRHCNDGFQSEYYCPGRTQYRDSLWNLFRKYNVAVEFAGHDHRYNVKVVDSSNAFDSLMALPDNEGVYCYSEWQYPHIADYCNPPVSFAQALDTVITPEDGTIEHINAFNGTAPYQLIRVDGTQVSLELWDGTLQNRFYYDASSLFGGTKLTGTRPVKPSAALSVMPGIYSGSGINFNINLVRHGSFNLTVYDIAGKQVWSYNTKAVYPGRYSIRWDFGADKILNGLYFVQLKQAERSASNKFLILK